MLTLELAKNLCDSALQSAAVSNLNPLTVVVLDAGGHPVCVMRQDGAGILRYEIAYGKAWGALGMGMGTSTFSELTARQGTHQSFVQSLMVASGGRVIPTRGGILIRNRDGQLIGAMGISGDSPENDEQCALYAIQKHQLIPQP